MGFDGKLLAKDSASPFLCCQPSPQREEIDVVKVNETTSFIDEFHDGI